jgi:putative two-component system response regulator
MQSEGLTYLNARLNFSVPYSRPNGSNESIGEIVEDALAPLKFHDPDVIAQSSRTAGLARRMALRLLKSNTYKGDLRWLGDLDAAARLHDIGKLLIDPDILLKPGALTAGERLAIQQHPLHGAGIINGLQSIYGSRDCFKNIAFATMYHHERWDGLGYPFGLSEKQIPLIARVIAIVDVYDALLSKRCYKDAMSHDEAVTIIIEGQGTQFDPFLVDTFLQEFAPEMFKPSTHRGFIGERDEYNDALAILAN